MAYEHTQSQPMLSIVLWIGALVFVVLAIVGTPVMFIAAGVFAASAFVAYALSSSSLRPAGQR